MQREEIFLIIKELIKENKRIHISLSNKRFYNGFVSEIKDDVLSFIDDKLGDIPIPYSLIINVEPFIEK